MVGFFLTACLLYCLIAPKKYDATAVVALRMQPASTLSVEGAETMASASILSTPLELETLVNVLRSEDLRWRVIRGERLYAAAGFDPAFVKRFPKFDVNHPEPAAQERLLDRFDKLLRVRVMPRTLLVEVRFRSRDPELSARVANALVTAYQAREVEMRRLATQTASSWLQGQLDALTATLHGKEKELAAFESSHGFLTTEQSQPGGQPMETLRNPAVQQVDETERLWSQASGDRILRQALYVQAQQGDPEAVLAANPDLQAEMGPGGAAMAQQLRGHLSEVQVELAQLRLEHGPNYPHVQELERAAQEITAELKAEDAKLLDGFERSWKAAAGREEMLRKQLDEEMAQGVKENDATIRYASLLQEVESGQELCTRLRRRIEEAGMSAGVRGSSISVVDEARVPFKAATPDVPLYLAIALFVGGWVAVAMALLLDAMRPMAKVGAVVLVAFTLFGGWNGRAQAPTPNTQGLPTGVVRLPEDAPVRNPPNPKTAPQVWSAGEAVIPQPVQNHSEQSGAAMALPIAAGDFLEVSEFHLQEFHAQVRVAADGTVELPLVGAVQVRGMSEHEAARAIEKVLLDKGMLVHPQVAVMVTNAAGQDVSVMGEVARPGVYAYTVHHRLLDVIAAAQGLTPNAGRLVNVFHRDDPKTPHPVVLEPTGAVSAADAKVDHDPELEPGDTVLVSRAGLAYVIGDVVRPGGFAVDPVQGLTVVQALSLAWGATPNAATGKAILIRDQPGGRMLTRLNLKRMIRGQDPDEPVRDRDILFVPDSTAKNLANKSIEAAIQSAIGVSIYAGLVYSQRF
ncbi:polysaccharide biosynthesis/export family protein [Acidicapsa dinghuensis]|uniref:Polysaccharide biosynthesis/export family protein n=1 Tax=Acidicapsa dinghuensis TaxID=2218256 RepID=A0ABW1EKZ1_9BACT